MQWDPRVATTKRVEHNHPDHIWETPEEVRIIETGCPSDVRVAETQKEKEEKYIELQTELSKLRTKKVVIAIFSFSVYLIAR